MQRLKFAYPHMCVCVFVCYGEMPPGGAVGGVLCCGRGTLNPHRRIAACGTVWHWERTNNQSMRYESCIFCPSRLQNCVSYVGGLCHSTLGDSNYWRSEAGQTIWVNRLPGICQVWIECALWGPEKGARNFPFRGHKFKCNLLGDPNGRPWSGPSLLGAMVAN